MTIPALICCAVLILLDIGSVFYSVITFRKLQQSRKQNHLEGSLSQIEEQLQETTSKVGDALKSYVELMEQRADIEHQLNQAKDELEQTTTSQYQMNIQLKNTTEELNLKVQEIQKAREILRKEEQENKEEKNIINISDTDWFDIQTLRKIRAELHTPRVLDMLIWSTFYQKIASALFSNVLGKDKVCGIYLITNLTNNKVYVGQSVDINRRWTDHAKAGCGIDAPANNILYKDMYEYGLQSFSFEVLEECSKDKLNEKEKFYINMYESNVYGYNQTKGNN